MEGELDAVCVGERGGSEVSGRLVVEEMVYLVISMSISMFLKLGLSTEVFGFISGIFLIGKLVTM